MRHSRAVCSFEDPSDRMIERASSVPGSSLNDTKTVTAVLPAQRWASPAGSRLLSAENYIEHIY